MSTQMNEHALRYQQNTKQKNGFWVLNAPNEYGENENQGTSTMDKAMGGKLLPPTGLAPQGGKKKWFLWCVHLSRLLILS